MYSRFVISIIRHAYGLCAVKEYIKITLISTSMVYNLISLLMLPVNIRLAGQLVMQVFKYRFIVRYHATDPDENKVMTAYYQHFQVALAIVFCILGFNVFNFIFQLYLSVSVAKDEWDREFEIGYYTGVIAQVFQEAIMLFGLTLVLQFDYYFNDEKFKFKRFLIAIVLRIVYLLNLEFVVGAVLPKFIPQDNLTDSLYSFPFLLSLLYLSDASARIFLVYSYVWMSLRRVKRYLREFINDIGSRYLARTRYSDKIRAGKLLRIAAWGTYFLNICFFVDALTVGFNVSLSSIFQLDLLTSVKFRAYFSIITLNGLLMLSFLVSILPSVLYSLFLIILWLYFRHRSKIKLSGYSSLDVPLLIEKNRRENIFTNQDHLHHVFYRPKNKILFFSYGIIIAVVSLVFSLTVTPLLVQQSLTKISLGPGDYYEFHLGLKSEFESCAYIGYSLSNQVNDRIPVYCSNAGNESVSCSEVMQGINYEKSTFAFKRVSFHSLYTRAWWLPRNSSVSFAGEVEVDQLFYSQSPFFLNLSCYYHYSINYDADTPCFYYQHLNVTPNRAVNCSNGRCVTLQSGMYNLKGDSYNISKMSYQTTGDGISYHNFSRGNGITDIDMIIFETTRNAYDFLNDICLLKIHCYRNPIFSILLAFGIFGVTMFSLVLMLICIHKI